MSFFTCHWMGEESWIGFGETRNNHTGFIYLQTRYRAGRTSKNKRMRELLYSFRASGLVARQNSFWRVIISRVARPFEEEGKCDGGLLYLYPLLMEGIICRRHPSRRHGHWQLVFLHDEL